MIDQFSYFYNLALVEPYLAFQGLLLQVSLERLSIIYALRRHKLSQSYLFTNTAFSSYILKQTKSVKENQKENIGLYNFQGRMTIWQSKE
jgi:hypothetical protein